MRSNGVSSLMVVALCCQAPASLAAEPASAGKPNAPTLTVSKDLSKPFSTRSAWSLAVTQAPSMDDPIGMNGQVPGAISLCLHKDAGPCDADLQTTMPYPGPDQSFSEPHYLNRDKVFFPGQGPATPILLVQTASLHAVDGDQVVFTQVMAYRADADSFVRIYSHQMEANNNQEVRYVDAGPLRGDIIEADPAQTAPFGYWITVNAFTPGSSYRQVLHYRSATAYGDGNGLPVIDSEMPNIQQRLGVWRAGLPLPLPAAACPKPRLIRMELWCE